MKLEKVDFAIITILPEEYEAIYQRFTPTPYTDPSTRHTYGISYVETKGGKGCTVAIARTSRPGNDASQQLAHWMINDLDPQMLLVVGIGGGVPDTDFTLGDVIVSSYIHNFDVNAIKGKETTYDVTGGIHPAISNIAANLFLYQSQLADWNTEASIGMSRPVLLLTEKRLTGLIDRDVDEPWREKVEKALMWHFDRKQRGARAPKFLTGTIASSNTLVRSDAVLAQWLQDARSIRAVEMEVAGIYQAAQHIRQQYPVMAIRGLSDIIGFKRDDNWKLYACHTAAAFAHAFITAGIVEPRDNTVSALARVPAAISDLYADRLGKIVAGETPHRLEEQTPKLVLHIIPFQAFDPAVRFDPSTLTADNVGSSLLGSLTFEKIDRFQQQHSEVRLNFDGLLCFRAHTEYVQIFRNGSIEAVNSFSVEESRSLHALPGVKLERGFLQVLKRGLTLQQLLGVELPVFVMVSLLGVLGYQMQLPGGLLVGYPIDRQDLVIPEVVVDTFTPDYHQVMKPIFDTIWNAAGYGGSANYTEDGQPSITRF